MKRNLWTLLTAALAGLMLTGCATGADPTPSESPMKSPSPTPGTTVSASPDAPMSTDGIISTNENGLIIEEESVMGTSAGVSTPAQARKAMEQIEDELEKLSEVEDAEVVLAGDTAAVALEFDSQYQGGVDERLRKIVRERVDGVIKGVKNIEITEDLTLLDELSDLGDRLEDAADLTKIRTELDALIRRITGKAM